MVKSTTTTTKTYENLIEVKPSLIKGAGMGTFAKKQIKKGQCLGTYFGIMKSITKKQLDTYNTDYSWAVHESKDNLIIVDTVGLPDSPLTILKYVNGAKNQRQMYMVNCLCKIKDLQPIYYATRDIHPNEELIVDYGSGYWKSR